MNWKWRASLCSDEKTSDPIQSDGLSYLFRFDSDVERQCAVFTSKNSVQCPPLNLNPAFLSHRRRATRLPSAQDSPFFLFTYMHKLIRALFALFAWLLLLCLVLFPRAAAHVQLQTLTLLENVNKSCWLRVEVYEDPAQPTPINCIFRSWGTVYLL